ncbi:hypothetical protein BJV82DRAFT_604018 [Fennellomyces sp. T-0311]|nr:hypothetical protein BJV82DRAFT_604018 [Fennellomyces sp. T-0311]
MGTIYNSYDNLQTFLGINISITIFNIAALIGSVISSLRTWQHYPVIHALSIASSFSLLISQVFIYVIKFGPGTTSLTIATMFFENIFPPLVWCLLVRVVLLAGEARLRFHDPERLKKGRQADVFVKTWTGILIAINVALAIAYGINNTDNEEFTTLYLLQYFSNIMFPIQLTSLLVSATYHSDIRTFATSFYAVFLLLVCVSAGSITIGAFTLIDEQYTLTGILQDVMIRFVGAIALVIIVVLLPTVWTRCIRENQAINGFMPAEPLNDVDSWNANAPYDINHQGIVQVNNQQQRGYSLQWELRFFSNLSQ